MEGTWRSIQQLAGNNSGAILFAAFFLLYGLEFFIPLVSRRSRHLWSNLLLLAVLTVINLLFTSLTFSIGGWIESENIGLLNAIEANTAVAIVLSILFLDLWSGYLIHVLFHQYEWLWGMHSIHHSDDLVDVTTAFRQHPLESLIRIVFQFTGMILFGIPVWILLIYLTLSTLHAQFEHANIRLPSGLDRWLQLVIVTPNMHKVHHSKYQHETDTNYSNIFSFWDRLFRTYRQHDNYAGIDYGLDYLHKQNFTFWELLKMPFRKRASK